MRVRWRGLELPRRVYRGEGEQTESYAEFVVEPFEAGFGTTIGNSLRRVLLSSLEGAAITAVKIDGVSHEFTSLEGVLEDVTDIILNIKGIILRYEGEEPVTMTVERTGDGEVRARDIQVSPSVEIVNVDHVIATLTSDVSFRAEFVVATGRGYRTASDNRSPDQEVGVIPVDSVFSPVRRVRYRTENVRVGQLTNYDRLILEVWTDGTVKPEDALVEAGLILRKHLNPFVQYHEMGGGTVSELRTPADNAAQVSGGLDEVLDRPISALNLSVRSSNCLDAARITTIRELIALTEADLLRFRSFGKTSLVEVHAALGLLGLSLNESAEGVGVQPAIMAMSSTQLADHEAVNAVGTTDAANPVDATDAANPVDAANAMVSAVKITSERQVPTANMAGEADPSSGVPGAGMAEPGPAPAESESGTIPSAGVDSQFDGV